MAVRDCAGGLALPPALAMALATLCYLRLPCGLRKLVSAEEQAASKVSAYSAADAFRNLFPSWEENAGSRSITDWFRPRLLGPTHKPKFPLPDTGGLPLTSKSSFQIDLVHSFIVVRLTFRQQMNTDTSHVPWAPRWILPILERTALSFETDICNRSPVSGACTEIAN